MAKRRAPALPSSSAAESEDWRRCRVWVAVISKRREYSKRLGPGGIVNLNEMTYPGVRLRDLVKEEWFDPESPPKEKTTESDSRPTPEPGITEENKDGA
jgi:hypothetical protein